MTEHVEQTIAMIREEIVQLEAGLHEKKRLVNHLCSYAKLPVIYGEADLLPSTAGMGMIRPDEYYGQPLAKAIRMVLERRQVSNIGPATVNEIYDALVDGGFKFETKNDDNAKRNLYTALTKNTATFHKLPNGAYGLLEWYPSVKESRASKPVAVAAGKVEKSAIDSAFEADDDEDPLKGFGIEDDDDMSAAVRDVVTSPKVPKKG